MPGVYTLIQYRRRRRSKYRRSPLGRLSLFGAGLLTLLVAVIGIYAAYQYARAVRDLPSIENLPALLEPPDGLLLQPTRFYDRSGEHLLLALEPPSVSGRQYLRLPGVQASDEQAFSEPLVMATLAAADPDFYHHSGASLAGLLSSQPSTLAERLVSDLLLADEPDSLRRSVRMRILATQITRRFGREKVLEWYLNSAEYGRLAFGADTAARLYLGKSAADLNLAESALLAAVALDPLMNPIDAPQAAQAGQKKLLLAMLAQQRVSPEAASRASQEPLPSSAAISAPHPGQAWTLADLDPAVDPAPLQIALSQIESRIPLRQLERGGLAILTTLDYDLQQETACAIEAQVARVTGASAGAPACDAARLLPTLDPARLASAGDLSAGVLVLDPQAGQILALISSPPAGPSQADLLPSYPPGTLSTPFIYLTAFTRGLGPASLVWDIPSPEDPPALSPTQDHGPVRLRIALANDYLRPADQILAQVGIDNVWRTAGQFGLSTPQNLGVAHSTALTLFRPFNLLEIGQAFSVMANNGLLAGHAEQTDGEMAASISTPIRPSAVLSVAGARPESAAGQTWLDWTSWQTRPIISAQLAYLVTNVLSDEAARWPSLGHPNPLEIGRPAAAKIGGGLAGTGAWVAGYTRERVAVIWLGRKSAGSQPGSAEASPPVDSRDPWVSASAGLYHAVMKTANAGLPVQSWEAPDDIVTLRVCDPSGMLPTAYCPNVVTEIFLPGAEPLQTDRLYNSVPINRETGRLATIFTPPDLIEQRPYMLVPPEAAAWAKQSGLDTPPEIYDTLTGTTPPLPDVRITSPAPFAVLGGKIKISGTAAGANFDFYRVQAGKGLNPRDWFLIGEESSRAVSEGTLVEWDTSSMSGLYALELMVVRKDQSVQRSVVLVTVDNQPPQIKILSPVLQEEISLAGRPSMVLLADVSDDLKVASVEIYLDDRRLAAFSQPPYAITWTCALGSHRLRVVAVDQAGNTTETSTTFTVIR